MTLKNSKEKNQLKVEKRKITGRKVKKLRGEGILPANIYGKKIKSLAVQLPLKDFLPVYKKVGEIGIVEVKVVGEEKPRPTLIHNVQLHPVTDKPLHADFYQVDLKERVTTNIPVELVGESPAVAQKIGVLIQPLTEIEIEALPTDLPEKFTVDVSKLEKIDDAFRVGDIKPPTGVEILTGVNQILAKIEPPTKEEVAPPPVEEKSAAEKEEKKEEEKPEEKSSTEASGNKSEEEK